MNKRFLCLLLILIPLVATSACIGGDENIDKWNDIVTTANAYAETGGDLLTEAEDAYWEGEYDLALLKATQANDEFNKLAKEVNDLRDVAQDMDKDFAEDYVLAWQRKINSGQSYIENFKVLVNIDKFDVIYQDILATQGVAFDHMSNFMDYYNSNNYQLAASSSAMAQNSFQGLVNLASDLDDVAQEIGVGYVMDYAEAGLSLFSNFHSFVEYGNLASSAALSGDFTAADNYVNQANVYYTNADVDQNTLYALEDAHPDEFPASGLSLNDLYDQYYSALENDMDMVEQYSEEMEDIEDDNTDFFEE